MKWTFWLVWSACPVVERVHQIWNLLNRGSSVYSIFSFLSLTFRSSPKIILLLFANFIRQANISYMLGHTYTHKCSCPYLSCHPCTNLVISEHVGFFQHTWGWVTDRGLRLWCRNWRGHMVLMLYIAGNGRPISLFHTSYAFHLLMSNFLF